MRTAISVFLVRVVLISNLHSKMAPKSVYNRHQLALSLQSNRKAAAALCCARKEHDEHKKMSALSPCMIRSFNFRICRKWIHFV